VHRRPFWRLLAAGARSLVDALRSRRELVVENLALRQQLAVLQPTSPRPHLSGWDRAFSVTLRRLWARWADVLVIVQPATVVRWQQRGFARLWAWRSRHPARERPPVAAELRELSRSRVHQGVRGARRAPRTPTRLPEGRPRARSQNSTRLRAGETPNDFARASRPVYYPDRKHLRI